MENITWNIPLAERIRPVSLEEYAGQEHLIGSDKLLGRLIHSGKIPSLILWGPPGTGKTTLASILANYLDAEFIFFSAVLSGVKDIRRIVEHAKISLRDNNIATILFVDEIHRFNKSQQDAFLPHVESGLLTLIGATTENPSFNVIAPLLSRCQVLVLYSLSDTDIKTIVQRALENREKGMGTLGLTITPDALDMLARYADGDSRRALNCLETAAAFLKQKEKSNKSKSTSITQKEIEEAGQHRSLRYDKDGEEHYNLISALHKSLRDSDPDGSAYWLSRMLASGEDPLYVARRLIRFASEDIGNADPHALQLALNCRESFHILGSPEGELALLQCVTYLATAPKSNAVYLAEKKIKKDIKKTGSLPVPLHLRNAPTKLMKKLDYGKGYKYAHDDKYGLIEQEHLPSDLKGRVYYEPTTRGYESIIRDRLTKWRKILRERALRDDKNKT